MNRIVGIETEYGCLAMTESGRSADSWPARVKNHLFKKGRVGALDQHYRDYEEPPGNGGFLTNGGRIYLDMGHLEFASPECATLADLIASDRAGDQILQQAVEELGLANHVSLIKNNIDHETDATFGSHENFLVSRNFPFTRRGLGLLIPFLVTRQIFTGAGRIGTASPDWGIPVVQTIGGRPVVRDAMLPP